jgi:Mrp family chromosome partitioning ATPase
VDHLASIASSKGGPGKTTVCMLLAGQLAHELKVAALDADPAGAFIPLTQDTAHSPRQAALSRATRPSERRAAASASRRARQPAPPPPRAGLRTGEFDRSGVRIVGWARIMRNGKFS